LALKCQKRENFLDQIKKSLKKIENRINNSIFNAGKKNKHFKSLKTVNKNHLTGVTKVFLFIKYYKR